MSIKTKKIILINNCRWPVNEIPPADIEFWYFFNPLYESTMNRGQSVI